MTNGTATGTAVGSAETNGAVNDNTHIERTANQFRQRGFYLARIEKVQEATPSVRLIDLKVLPPSSNQADGLPYHPCEEQQSFTFQPGQWIDTYVPHLAKPGGFSFVSSPKTFKDHGIASLAIQKTDNPPSKWLWQDGILGQRIMMKVGGNFTFPPSKTSVDLDTIDYVQFIAGGVGINPLISMLRFINEEHPLKPNTRVVLHYLVRMRAETLFVDAINQIKESLGDLFDGHIWITRQETQLPNPSFPAGLQVHHLEAFNENLVGQSWEWCASFSNYALEHFDIKERQEKSLVYICGPQGLTDRLVKVYEEHGMSTKDGHVQIEKWW